MFAHEWKIQVLLLGPSWNCSSAYFLSVVGWIHLRKWRIWRWTTFRWSMLTCLWKPACTLKDQSTRTVWTEMFEFHTNTCLGFSVPGSLFPSLERGVLEAPALSAWIPLVTWDCCFPRSPPFPVSSNPSPPLWLHYLCSGSEPRVSHMDHITASQLSPPTPSHPSSAMPCGGLAKRQSWPRCSLG